MSDEQSVTPPIIDVRVEYKSVSHLRQFNGKSLAALDHVIVIQVEDEPVAVIIPFLQYLTMQEQMSLPRVIFNRSDFDSDGFYSRGGVEMLCELQRRVNELMNVTGLPEARGDVPSDLLPQTNRCEHCHGSFGEVGDEKSTLCGSCFISGHRSGACVPCRVKG